MPVVAFSHLPGLPSIAATALPAPGPSEIGAHAHEFLTLFYAHRADDTMVIDGRPWAVADGDLFVIGPGQVVSIDSHETVAAEGWAVWFPADVIQPGTPGAYSSWRSHPLLFPFASGVDRAQRLRVPPAERAAGRGRGKGLDPAPKGPPPARPPAAPAHHTRQRVA
ncbi:AraC family transcriptional regulator, partial [Actinoplanes sp. NPDC051633]